MAHLSCGYGSIRTHRAARADPNLPRQQASGYHPRSPTRLAPRPQLPVPQMALQRLEVAHLALAGVVALAVVVAGVVAGVVALAVVVAGVRVQALARAAAAAAQQPALEVVLEAVAQQPAAEVVVAAVGLRAPQRASVGQLWQLPPVLVRAVQRLAQQLPALVRRPWPQRRVPGLVLSQPPVPWPAHQP